MELLKQEEFNECYFDGKHQTMRHNAGYSEYLQGQMFENIYHIFKNTIDFTNKKVLDICCAKGFLVEILRNNGIQAYGVDWSNYALDNAPENIRQYLYYGLLPEYLKNYPDNEFDLVVSSNSLCCFSDLEINTLVSEFNRISKEQCHLVSEEAPKKFYNSKSIIQWIEFDWKPGTIITNLNGINIIK